MSSRERFEAWAVKPEQSLHIERHPDWPDTYHFWTTELTWVAYKAAQAEALEEAADACFGGDYASPKAAEAIRALKDKEPA